MRRLPSTASHSRERITQPNVKGLKYLFTVPDDLTLNILSCLFGLL